MITLPTVASGTKTSTTSTVDVASAAETDLTAGLGASVDDAGADGAQGFLSLLGNKIQMLARQGEAAGRPAVLPAGASEQDKSPKTKLNALLATLDNPEALTALLKPEAGKAEVKSGDIAADAEDSDPVASLNDSDRQTLQALFAMLPPVINAPPAATAKLSEAAAGSSEKGSRQTTLASLLATGSQAGVESDKESGNSGKPAVGGLHGVNAQKNTAESPTLTTAFQQISGQTGKDAEKDRSGSAPGATITHNVISAASAVLTPTTASTVTAPATPMLNAQLGSQEWQQALGQQILLFTRNGQQKAELHLNPQDLGSIQISLKLDNDQAQLSMISNHSQVRAAAEAALPHLRAALAESGINLGQSNVSSDAFQQGQGSNAQQEQQRNSRGNTFSLASENDSDVTPVAVPASLQARASGSNAVDIFA